MWSRADVSRVVGWKWRCDWMDHWGGESSHSKCLVTHRLRTVRSACCGPQLLRGHNIVSRTLPVRLEYQPILARTVYTWLEDHGFYFRSEGGGLRTLKVVFSFSFSYIDQFNENYCLSLQSLGHFQRQLFPLRSFGDGRCSAFLQIRPFILKNPQRVKNFPWGYCVQRWDMTEPFTNSSWVLPETTDLGRNEGWSMLPSPARVMMWLTFFSSWSSTSAAVI